MLGRVLRRTSLIMVVVLVAAACGGGGSDIEEQLSTASSVPGGDTNSTVVLPTAIPNIPGLSNECQGLINLMLGFTQAFTGGPGTADQLFATAAADVPAQLKGEVETITTAVTQYGAALEGLGIESLLDPNAFANLTPQQMEQLEAASDLIDTDEVNDAFDAISVYAEVECASFIPGG